MNKNNIVLFGGGLHSNVCIDIIEKEGKYNIVGIIDSKAEINQILYGYKILGRQEDVKRIVEEYNIDAGLVAIGDNYSRELVANYILSILNDFQFINAIHPNAIIGRNVKLGLGNVIMAGAIINPDVAIGDFCIMNTGTHIEHNAILEDYVHISTGSIIGAKVIIGKYSSVTMGAVLIDRITIGRNTVIGSCSFVNKDLPDNIVAYGVPAKIIRTRTKDDKFLKSL